MKRMWNLRAERDAFFYVETRYWNGDIEGFYDLGEQRTQVLIDPVVGKYLGQTAHGGSALDVGCGVGRFSRALASRFASVVGVDVADEMVRIAREQHPSSQYPRLRFEVTDGESIGPVAERSMDFVFCYEVIQHLPSRESVQSILRGIQKTLKRNGVALMHFRADSLMFPYRLKRVVKSLIPRRVYKRLNRAAFTRDSTWTGSAFRTKEALRMSRSAGFEILDCFDDPTHEEGSRFFVVARPQLS